MRHRLVTAFLFVALASIPAFAQVTTRTLTGTIRKPDGSAWVGAAVKFELTKNTYTGAASFPASVVTATTNASGLLCVSPCSTTGVTLWTNAEGLAPAQYKVTYPDGAYFYFNLAAGATIDLSTVRAGATTPATPSNQAVLQTIVDAHAAAADPHAVYLTQPEGDARYELSGAGGVSDHGELEGLADDDHPQYLTGARGDARYSALGHSHDSLYFTEAETTALLAGKANTAHLHTKADVTDFAHTHTLADITDEGTAAVHNVPASGNAASNEVVLGSDTRLADARTPSAHTHAAADTNAGTFATARLGSGTPDATKFLRGDSTWAAPTFTEVGDVAANATRTLNRHTKWTDATNKVLGDSLVSDDGTNVTVTSGAVRAPNGSASAPSYAFTNETNTGMSLASAGILGFYVGGSRQLDVRALGRVFIPVDTAGLIFGSAGDVGVLREGNSAIKFVDSTTTAGATFYSPLRADTFAATMTINLLQGNVREVTLTANLTSLTLSNIKAGAEYTLIIVQDGTGSRTVTWPATVKWVGGAAPTLTTTAGAVDVFTFVGRGSNVLETGRNLDVR